MSINTNIAWCDSTANGQMGCDGCELWRAEEGGSCYAGNMTERYAGQKGWPEAFNKPRIFPGRFEEACAWPDLTGKARPDKPWLDGLPRLVFPNDMGDGFTESLPVDWIHPHIPAMEASPHQWLFLTKRVKRMRQCFESFGRVPKNFWLGASITDERTAKARIWELFNMARSGNILWVSFEPVLGAARLWPFVSGINEHWTGHADEDSSRPQLSWAVIGGESGPNRRELDLDVLRQVREDFARAEVPLFVKQDSALRPDQRGRIPDDLWVRQMPRVRVARAPVKQPSLFGGNP